jgi:formyltetrahydrofolate deformylase
VESAQYGDIDTSRFFMRIAFSAPDSLSIEAFKRGFHPVALGYNFDWQVHDLHKKPRVLIMVSKLGHCLNDLLYRHSTQALPMELVGVASNHQTWRRKVEAEDLDYFYLPIDPQSKAQQEAALEQLITESQVDLVILARYMQILSDDLSSKLQGKVINIHHSFLPSFKGAKPYHRAHARGVKMVGATAHYVTPDLDEGPIIEQDVARVEHNDSPEEMVAIGRDVESRVLARAVRYHLEHRILLNGERTVIFK